MLRLVWMLKLVYSFRILAMEVMPDHIHLLLNCKPQFRISDMVKIMKGNTARWLFLKYPELKQSLWGGHLWNPSCCAVTVSGRSREQVTHYINSQKERASKTRGRSFCLFPGNSIAPAAPNSTFHFSNYYF